MSLSTFSSDAAIPEPSFNSRSRRDVSAIREPVELLWIYFGTLLTLVAGLSLLNRYGSGRFLPLSVAAQPAPSPDFYLAYYDGGLEDYVIYNDIGGLAKELKRADVLFLGNSRMLYAMRDQTVLKPYFSARHLAYYSLAFAYGEGDRFPEAVIRKFDLHPKWVIVNADPFFAAPTSPLASKVMSGGSFDAFKVGLETNLSFYVERRLHRVLPYLGLSQWIEEPDWVYYRSRLDGTIRLAAYKGRRGSAERSPHAAPPVPFQEQVDEARLFVRELRQRGTNVVLTSVPPSPQTSADALGSLLGVSVIDCSAQGLETFDGSHLDTQSARRFSTELLQAFDHILGRKTDSVADWDPD